MVANNLMKRKMLILPLSIFYFQFQKNDITATGQNKKIKLFANNVEKVFEQVCYALSSDTFSSLKFCI